MIFPKNASVNQLMSLKRVIDCELMNKTGRADIVIRFYNNYQPVHAIIIEAKSIQSKTNSKQAAKQVSNYNNSSQLTGFPNRTFITLTNVLSFTSNIVSISWQKLLNQLQAKSKKDELIHHYITYIIKIQGYMKYYDDEVLLIPAGKSYNKIIDSGIYECPVNGRQFKSRGEKHPLFVSFKEARKPFTQLYKILEIFQLSLNDNNAIKSIDNLFPNYQIGNRIRKYLNGSTISNDKKYVFILDKNHIIKLPTPVKLTKANANIQSRTLFEMFQKPKSGQKVIILSPKTKKTTTTIAKNKTTP